MKRTEQIAFAVIFTGFVTLLSPALYQTTVSGVVIDVSGSEVPNASIQVMPRNERDEGTVGSLSRWIQTDAHGKFSVSLQPGRYKIAGKAEAGGYPNPVFAMCADPKADFPTISVGQSALSGVRVRLGVKGGFLEGTVHDKATRLHIQKGKVRIPDARDTSAYIEIFTNGDGSFHFTVPSKAVVIHATAAGYNQTQFNGGQELTLSGNEHRTISVELSRR